MTDQWAPANLPGLCVLFRKQLLRIVLSVIFYYFIFSFYLFGF